MGSCTRCHKAKVKCDNECGFPCKRCARLKLECVPHVSRQGKGRSNPRRKPEGERASSPSTSTQASEDVAVCVTCEIGVQADLPTASPTVRPLPYQSDVISQLDRPQPVNGNNKNKSLPDPEYMKRMMVKMALQTISQTQDDDDDDDFDPSQPPCPIETEVVHTIPRGISKDHFGLHHVLRSWLFMAIRQRSFPMMAKASQLATKVDISMDELMSLHHLAPVIPEQMRRIAKEAMQEAGSAFATPLAQQPRMKRRVHLDQIPLRYRETLNMMDETGVGNRCIAVRRNLCGVVSVYLSPQFEKYVMPWHKFDKLHNEQRVELKDILFGDDVVRKKMALATFQIMQSWRYPHSQPKFVRIPDVNLTLAESNEVVRADTYFWVMSEHIDESWMHFEFIPLDGRLGSKQHHRYHLQRDKAQKRGRHSWDDDDDLVALDNLIIDPDFDCETGKKQRVCDNDDNLNPIPLTEWDDEFLPHLPQDRIGDLHMGPELADWVSLFSTLE